MFEELEITQDMIDAATQFSDFRKRIKEILKNNGLNFDKFTITNRDSFDGFIAEKAFIKFALEDKKVNKKILITWEDENNLSKEIIDKINMDNSSFSQEELGIIRNYFYDKWDLKINNPTIDIKTAATHLLPTMHWTYGIPQIQVEKPGKDFVILNYLMYNKDPKKFSDAKPIKCVLIGALSIDDIKKCPIQTRNEAAGHQYQVNNYETKINNYEDIDTFLDRVNKIA